MSQRRSIGKRNNTGYVYTPIPKIILQNIAVRSIDPEYDWKNKYNSYSMAFDTLRLNGIIFTSWSKYNFG